jgi:hypothetical protein
MHDLSPGACVSAPKIKPVGHRKIIAAFAEFDHWNALRAKIIAYPVEN